MLLPQELFAEALWGDWFFHYGIFSADKLKELMRRYNLKLRKGKTIDDIRLAFGRGIIHGKSKLSIERIAEEIDKVCTIARWDFAVARYK